MKHTVPRRHVLALLGSSGLWLSGLDLATAASPAQGAVTSAQVAQVLPGVRMAGEGLLRVWGLQVYRSRLWVLPGFRAADYAQQPLVLELEYLRAFRATDIARRSIEEMRGIGAFTDAQAERWQRDLAALLPDVAPGDRLLGVHRPGQGARFYGGDKDLGMIEDPQFSRLFFGIWLDPKTSEPGLRQALLGS
jgi:hypothetical protein